MEPLHLSSDMRKNIIRQANWENQYLQRNSDTICHLQPRIVFVQTSKLKEINWWSQSKGERQVWNKTSNGLQKKTSKFWQSSVIARCNNTNSTLSQSTSKRLYQECLYREYTTSVTNRRKKVLKITLSKIWTWNGFQSKFNQKVSNKKFWKHLMGQLRATLQEVPIYRG